MNHKPEWGYLNHRPNESVKAPEVRIVDDSKEYREFETRLKWFLYGVLTCLIGVAIIRRFAI